MVPSEGYCAGQAHGDVAYHRHKSVQIHVAASAEMCEIVDAAVKGVVEEAADCVGVGQNEPNRHVLHDMNSTLER